MWVFVEGGKPEDPEKTLGTRTGINTKLNPHLTLGMKINLRATAVLGEHSHHCAIPATLITANYIFFVF